MQLEVRNRSVERLRGSPKVQRVPDARLDLYVYRNFLPPEVCQHLIQHIDAKRRPSEIIDDLGDKSFRTSETCDFVSPDPVARQVELAIAALLGLPIEHGEPMQGQRYAVGQEFKPHPDAFETTRISYFNNCADSGNRTWTAMIYLNEPEAGGATRFKTINKTIQPETGKLLTWYNLLAEGQPNPATLHQGMKVRKGTKYVLTKWFRERPFGA